jgi:PmbA protein
MNSVDDLLSIGNTLMTFGSSKTDQIEAYVSAGEEILVLCDGFDTQSKIDQWTGVGVRCVVDGKVGFASTNNASDTQKLKNCVKAAIYIAKHKPLDEAFVSLPHPQPGSSVSGDYDETISSMDVESISKSVTFRKDDIGHIIARTCTFGIVNSNGIETGDRYTRMKIYKENIKSGDLHILRSRTFITDQGIDEQSTITGNKETLEGPTQTDVVFTTRVSHFFIRPLVYQLAASNVQSRKSRFSLGDTIASDKVKLVDDGQLTGGLNTYVCDGEGIPMSKTILIKKGSVAAYLYDTYAAYKDDVASTGNGMRNDYYRPPSLHYSNFFVPSTTKNVLERVDDAFVISRVLGGFTVDPHTGDFSIVSQTPVRISSKGAQRYNPVVIKGNLFELLHHIIEVGDDRQFTEVGSIPSLWVEGVTLVP